VSSAKVKLDDATPRTIVGEFSAERIAGREPLDARHAILRPDRFAIVKPKSLAKRDLIHQAIVRKRVAARIAK